MTTLHPVVVYAASGYTGRLACESLTKLRVPFVAAGRNQARLDAIVAEMRAKGGDCVARVAEHTPVGLRALFHGAKVVINISGPFSLLGHAVVDAALVEGCHYLDSTGEQDFMFDLRGDYGASFERAKLVLSPSAAFLWGAGTAAAEVCLETPGIDSVEVTYAPPALQTVASLQSMFRSVRRAAFSIADGKLHPLPPDEVRKVSLPGGLTRKALRVGAGEATFFLGSERVRQCETWFANDTLARAVRIFGVWNRLGKVVPGKTMDELSDALVLKFKKNPAAEDEDSHRFVIAAVGRGRGREVRVTLNGTQCYALTGYICAVAAQSLLEGKAQRFGYQSLAQTFGARHVLTQLEGFGTKATIDAEPGAQVEAARPGVAA
ncbi:MAG TPA: DUF5938 domain-containing protein [Polyangiaceae bacterium]|jgi:short subunit dehydrogenase-like uncharacterized protein